MSAITWVARRTVGIMGPGQRFYTADLSDGLTLRVERSGAGWTNTIEDGTEGGSPGFTLYRPTLASAKAASSWLIEKVVAERRSIDARYPPGTRRPTMAERLAELQDILS